jgi:hypothetical protein
MEALGFYTATDQTQPHGTDWHGPYDLVVNLADNHEMTFKDAGTLIIHRALCAGKSDIQKALKKLLAV